MEVDAGLLLVSVLHEAERLKVEAGVLGHAVDGECGLLVHRAAGEHQRETVVITRCVCCFPSMALR